MSAVQIVYERRFIDTLYAIADNPPGFYDNMLIRAGIVEISGVEEAEQIIKKVLAVRPDSQKLARDGYRGVEREIAHQVAENILSDPHFDTEVREQHLDSFSRGSLHVERRRLLHWTPIIGSEIAVADLLAPENAS